MAQIPELMERLERLREGHMLIASEAALAAHRADSLVTAHVELVSSLNMAFVNWDDALRKAKASSTL